MFKDIYCTNYEYLKTSSNVKNNLIILVKELGPNQSYVPYFYGEIKSLQISKTFIHKKNNSKIHIGIQDATK